MIVLDVDTVLVSESNMREHWAVKSRRKKTQRQAVRCAWLVAGRPKIAGPICVRLTRITPKRRFIRDYDNLVGSFKAIIDEVADIAGIDDKDIIWPTGAFMQKEGKEPKCRVEVESLSTVGTDLTEMQIKFFKTMIKLWDKVGIPPTLAEMKESKQAVGTSPQSFVQYLDDKGYINRIPGTARGMVLTDKGRILKLAIQSKVPVAK